MNALLDQRDRTEGGFDPVLVTITIGANDVGLTDLGTFLQVGGRINSAVGFFDWHDGKAAAIASGLTPGIDNLLAHENVYIVLTDYPNPFPEGSFGGDACNDTFFSLSCHEALSQVVRRLNSMVIDQFLHVNQPGRLRIAALGPDFSSHTAEMTASLAWPPSIAWKAPTTRRPGSRVIAFTPVRWVPRTSPATWLTWCIS